jgi:hypothetical protein
MQSYFTAKFMLGFIILIGWIVIAIALIAFIIPIFQQVLWVKVFGLVAGCFSGLTLIALGQMGLAQIATAENTRRIIDLLEASLQGTSKMPYPADGKVQRIEPVLIKPK